MLSNIGGRLIELRHQHPENALFPMPVNAAGRLMELRLQHLENALSPILVT
jgi:hypothetical protein